MGGVQTSLLNMKPYQESCIITEKKLEADFESPFMEHPDIPFPFDESLSSSDIFSSPKSRNLDLE